MRLLGFPVRRHEPYLFVIVPLILPVTCPSLKFCPSAPSRWQAAMAIYMIGFISYGATLVFYAAIFPRLARNTRHARDLREKYENGEIEPEIYEREESLEKNRISNISTVGHSVLSFEICQSAN